MGKLIVIEGLDGSGKGTQCALLCEYLSRKAKGEVVSIDFPRYERESSALVRGYLAGDFGKEPDDVNCYAASSFYAADRYISYITEWREKYEAGAIFVCDRYTTSNAVFQTPKLEQGEWNSYLEWLYDFEYAKLGIPKPDAVIFLDISERSAAQLLKKRYDGDSAKMDIHESDRSYQRRCIEAARWCAKQGGWHVVSCDGEGEIRTVGDIAREINRIVDGANIW